MSQLLQVGQVHVNQRHMKTEPGEIGQVSPGMIASPGGGLSPMSMGPSSPQGMPIPRRSGADSQQHWIVNPSGHMSNSTMSSLWTAIPMDPLMESYDSYDPSTNVGQSDLDMSMEGELSKLSMAVDEDDIFKVERNDLLGPTLAELNAADADTLLDGLNFDDLYWPADPAAPEATPSPQTPAGGLDPDGDIVPFQCQPSSSFPPLGSHKMYTSVGNSVPVSTLSELTTVHHLPNVPSTHSDVNYAPLSPSTSSAPQQSRALFGNSSSSGGLRELLLRRELQNSLESPDTSPLGQSLPRSVMISSPGSLSPRLSTSAPSGQGHNPWETWQQRREAVWARRDPRPHILSTGSLAEGGSSSSLNADVLSPGREFSLSMDEGFDSDDVSERDSSDEESELSDTESNAGSTSGTRRERFFWQYNVQAKGPKGQRLVLAPTQEDPHVLQRPTDPVFSPLCHIQGIKHSGKARKGDGNDLTPNPRKLWAIGKELDRLNKVISEMTPVADLPTAVKSRSRKEKNKLASRACRLKKKAQHEANKLKLYGLEQEHKRLMTAIEQSRQLLFSQMDGTTSDLSESVGTKIERISKYGTSHRIGGHTTEYVNRVLEKVKQGVPDGGMNDL